MRIGVERQVADHQRGRAAGRAPAQQRPQAGQQLLALEGLDQVIVGAGVEAFDAGIHGVARGEDEDGHVAALAQGTGDIHAVDLGQTEVEDDEVGVEGVGLGEGHVAVVGDADLVALHPQRALQRLGNLGVVLDHEDPGWARVVVHR